MQQQQSEAYQDTYFCFLFKISTAAVEILLPVQNHSALISLVQIMLENNLTCTNYLHTAFNNIIYLPRDFLKINDLSIYGNKLLHSGRLIYGGGD